MKTSLFLLACLGLASALQPGLEYEYVYHSRIATGIPEIQRQFAGAAIRASITVQLQGESLMAQMTHIEVADMNGLIECDSRAPLPLEYKILPGYDEILKKPFFINGTTSLVVSKSEPYWITNIRKAVATLFTVKPLRDHEQHDGLLQTEAFHTPALVVDDEQSLAGICQNRYILTKLPDYLKQEHLTYIEETVEEDVQWVSDQLGSLKSKTSSKNTAKGHKTAGQKGSKGSKGSKGGKYKVNVPKIGNDVYVLTKSVNFNECKEMVKFQNYGYGIYCKLGSSQCGTILSRSSTGSFYLRGSPDALRIERVEIEGNIIMNPLGYETEKIRTVTNQTLELKAVRFMGSHLEMPANTRHVDSFMYEVESTVSSDQTSEHPYVHHQQTEDENTPAFYPTFIVSGLHTNQLTKAASAVGTQISRLLEEIWIDFKDFTLVEDEKKTDMAPRMNTIAELVMMLNYKELNTLFNSYDSGEDRGSFIRELLIDIMAMAGTDAPVRVLVEQIKNHNIGTERSAEVFMALSNSLQMPDHSIPRLIDLLKGLNINEDFQLTSSLILNLATAINRLCLVPQSRDTSQTNLLGQHYCHADSVLDEFLPLLENGLKEAQDVGHKFVYIHALTQMSTERKYNILKPIVLGNSETDYRVRSLACYAFQAYNSPKSFVPRVYHLMMPVFENQGEHFSVRMAAIGSLLSWEPDSAWWHRLAVASWRDLSRQMQSFISHLITSVAEMTGSNSQRQRAAHVLPMTKKFPASQRFSMTLLSDAYLEAIETGVILNTAWFHTVKSYIPVHYFQILIVKQGSFLNLLYELALDGHIDDLLYKTTKEPVNMRDPAARRAHNMYSQALMSLRMDEYTNFENYESTEPEHDGKFILSTRFFYNMRRIFMTGQNRDKMAHISNIPPSWTIVKYINPNQLFIAVPTDVGLPYIGKGSVPITFYSKGDLKLNTGPQIEVEAKLQTFASLQVQVTSEVVLPWNGIAVTSGIDVRRDVTLPVRVKALYDVNNYEGVLSVTPADQHEVSFVRHLNHPFTVRAPVVPNKPLMEQEDFKVIVQHKKLFQDQVSLGHEYTGMDVDLIWVGDIESPLNLPSALELLSYTPEEFFRVGLAPTLKNYEYKLNYHPTHSKTNTITFTFSATITEKSQKSYEQFTQNTGQFTGGQGADYEFGGQDYEESFQQGGSEVETLSSSRYSISDSVPERLAKIKKRHELMGSSRVSSVNAKVEFSGSEVHRYGVVLTWTSGDQSGSTNKIITKAQATLLKGTDTKTEDTMCIDLRASQPYISHLMDLSDVLENDLKSMWKFELREDENCQNSPSVEIEVSIDMTQERKDTIVSTINSKEFCAKDLEVHEHIQAVYDDVQIGINWEQDKMDCSPLMNLTHHLEDLTRGFLFPHVTHNYCGPKTAPGKANIHATRCIEKNLWTVWTTKPSEVYVVDHLHVPEYVDEYFSFSHDYHLTDYDIPLLHDECHVYEESIITFDGLNYPFERNLCWQVLTMDVEHSESWMLLHRLVEYPKPGPQLRFISPQGSVVVDITSEEAKVNGKPVVMAQDREVVRHEGKVQAIVELHKDEIYVEIPDVLSVSMKDSHMVVRLDHYTVGGLCGARDGEVTGDLQGPNRCVYYKPELFTASWMAGGDGGCDPYAMDEIIRNVENYQQHCPKLHTQATGPAHNWH